MLEEGILGPILLNKIGALLAVDMGLDDDLRSVIIKVECAQAHREE